MAKCKISSENTLLLLTVASVALAVGAGIILKMSLTGNPQMTPRALQYLRFPGELFLRMLKLLILPLITSSLINSLASLDSKTAGRIGSYATLYYLCTTVAAVLTGIVLVMTIRPGGNTSKSQVSHESDCQGAVPVDTLLDLLRNMFPSNLVSATFQAERTCVRYKGQIGNQTGYIAYNKWMNMTEGQRASWLAEPFQEPKPGMNILGLVVFALVFGGIINRMEEAGRPLANFFCALESAMMRMVTLVIWISPIGIFFLITSEIMKMQDLGKELEQLAMYMVTVVVGLLVHALITLPILLVVLGRRNPVRFIYGMLQAILTAFGTASSSATMPVTLECLEVNNKVDPRVSRFVIPLGATINMDGTALYEAVAAIYIAQVANESMTVGSVVLISLTATLASVGAAGIPQAGLVTMIMVLLAVGLDPAYVSLILPVDWLLDRVRTAVNVHGDSIGAGIVQTLCAPQLAADHHLHPALVQADSLPMTDGIIMVESEKLDTSHM